MSREKVIVFPIAISKAGQIVQFQIRLPKRASKIIGIECGFLYGGNATVVGGKGKIDSGNSFKRGKTVAELKLQSCDKVNVFFSTFIKNDLSFAFLDFTNPYWPVKPYIHQRAALEVPIEVNSKTTVIKGILKDLAPTGDSKTVVIIGGDKGPLYTVNLYIWYELKEKYDGNRTN